MHDSFICDAAAGICDPSEPRAMSTAAASEADDADAGGISCNGGGGHAPGAEPGLHGDDAACHKTSGIRGDDAVGTARQREMSVNAGGTANMPAASHAHQEDSAMRQDADGAQPAMSRTEKDDATANGSAMTISEAPASTAPLVDVNIMTNSRLQEDSGISNCSRGGLNGTAMSRMMSSEGQRSQENLSGGKSGATEGSMGTVSVADAGSGTLANGHEAPDPAALTATAVGSNGGGEQLDLRDEDLQDAAETDQDCNAFAFPGALPLDDWSLTDDEAQLILGAQVERSNRNWWRPEHCLQFCERIAAVHTSRSLQACKKPVMCSELAIRIRAPSCDATVAVIAKSLLRASCMHHHVRRPVLQANLWTEFVPDEETAEYMLLPRLAAMAEALWSRRGKDWPAFRRRLENLLPHYDAAGLRYRPLD